MNHRLLFASVLYHPKEFDNFFEDFMSDASDLVLVSNSRDRLLEEHINKEFQDCQLILNDMNIGFGPACNIAIRWAIHQGADFLCIFNQDVKLSKSDISTMCSHFEKDEDLMLISPFNLNRKGEPEEYFYRNFLENGGDFHSIGLQYVSFVNAACWLLDLKKVKICGGFNEYFFMYGEDLNYAHRLKYLGYKMAVDMNCKVLHHKSERDYHNSVRLAVKVHLAYLMAFYLNPAIKPRLIQLILRRKKYGLGKLLSLDLKGAVIEILGVISFLWWVPMSGKIRKEQNREGAFL